MNIEVKAFGGNWGQIAKRADKSQWRSTISASIHEQSKYVSRMNPGLAYLVHCVQRAQRIFFVFRHFLKHGFVAHG